MPLVVDDEGNAVEVEVEKDGTVKSRGKDESNLGEKAEATEDQASRKEEAKSGFGARKRKAGRIVGDETAGQEDEEAKSTATKSTVKHPEGKSEVQAKEKKPKKKGKKIKLSFDEEEE